LETFRSGGTIDLVKNRRTCFVGVEGGARLCFSGGMELELLTLPDTAHSKWDLFVFIPGEGILCTGDAVVEYQTAYFHGADIQSWISSLRHLAGLKGRAVLSGHGPSLFPWNYIGEFADFLETLERAARTCLARYGDSWKTDKERFALVDTASVRTLVDQYFAEGEEDARFIAAKAGDDDGRREVRMVLWSFIREYIR
jgi:hypothetical protein